MDVNTAILVFLPGLLLDSQLMSQMSLFTSAGYCLINVNVNVNKSKMSCAL